MGVHEFPINPPNPTDSQRHQMLKNALMQAGRIDDYENIVKLLRHSPDITHYASPGEFKGVKIGIIGAGLAGLSTAFELRKLGADITIFDASEDRIGGRVYTYYFDKERKYYGEMGAVRIPISHETTWFYINKFKLNTNPFVQVNPNAFVYVHNTRVRNDLEGRNITEKIYPKYNLTPRERNTPWSKLYYYAINYPLKKLPSHIRTEILKILPTYSPPYSQLISMNFRQVFEMLGLSQEAISLISSVDPLTGSMLYMGYAELLQEMYPLDFSALYQISGGMSNLPLAFYKSLISKHPTEYNNVPDCLLGEIVFKSGHFVNGIYKSHNSNKVILRYINNHLSQDLTEAFDYVVCTIPFSTLREVDIKPLFSNKKMQAIRELNYIDAQRTLLLCNRRFWEENTEYGRIIGGISYTDLPIQSIIYPSDHALYKGYAKSSPDEPGVLMASYNFWMDATRLGNINDQRRIEVIKRNVEDVHGLPKGYLNSVVSEYKTVHWNSQEWSRGAVAITLPEQKNIFLYDILKPEYNNRVFFAGEHASATHGWMQGALFSGKLAANMLAYYIKRRNYDK